MATRRQTQCPTRRQTQGGADVWCPEHQAESSPDSDHVYAFKALPFSAARLGEPQSPVSPGKAHKTVARHKQNCRCKAISSSKGSSQPRDQTPVSRTTGGFSTI